MNFYKQIEPFEEYLHSIRKLKNYLSFDLKYPNKWLLPKNMIEEGQVVTFDLDDSNFRGISFVTEIKETEIQNTISSIIKVIKINKEKEQKELLFKQYVDKLKTTFEGNELTKLQKLYFEFEEEIPNLEITNNHEESETFKLVGEREKEGPNGARQSKTEIDRPNNKIKEGRLVSQ